MRRSDLVSRLRGGALDRLLPKESDYRGLSVSKLAGVRLRIGAEWLVQSLVNRRAMRDRLAETRSLMGSARGTPAVVLATGPSLSTLDRQALTKVREAGGKVFAVNFYSETSTALDVRPDYYVLADPAFLVEWESHERASRVWDYILERPRPAVFVPAHIDVSALPGNPTLRYFNGLGLDGWSRNSSPLRPRGFLGITAYHAISIALFMGHDPVFTLGIDNDAFRSVAVTGTGRVVLGGHHAYDDDREYDLPGDSEQMPAMLEDYARVFADLRLFDADRLVNLAPTSLITEYPRGSLREWLGTAVSDGGGSEVQP